MTTSSLTPFRTVGRDNPFWVLQYDKHGSTRSPETLAEARRAIRSGDYTDVVVFSHGWNNDWNAAITRYNEFVDGLVGQLPDHPGRRALLLGIFWPSALLVMPGEREPMMAAALGNGSADPDAEALGEVTEELDPADADRVRTLSAKSQLDADETAELAELLAPVYRAEGPEIGEDPAPPAAAGLAEGWLSSPSSGTSRRGLINGASCLAARGGVS